MKLNGSEVTALTDILRNPNAFPERSEAAEVSNVAEFVHCISQLKDAAYFRGESREFERRDAKALRRNDSADPVKKLCSEYRAATFSKLTENEKENFAAFSQHHGIPTNLLDVSSNPLIALYFACEADPESDGFVYLFDDDFIDLTAVLSDEHITDTRKFAEDARRGNVSGTLTKALEDYRERHLETMIHFIVNTAVVLTSVKGDKFVRDILPDIRSIVKEHRKCGDNMEEWTDISKSKFPYLYNSTVDIYIKLLGMAYEFISALLSFPRKCGLSWQLTPTIMYRPNLTFDRAQRQVSSFIVQPYVCENGVFLKDIVRTAYSIRVKADSKKEILDALDMCDVNKKTIFKDFDSVASYVTEKHVSNRRMPMPALAKLDNTILSGSEVNYWIKSLGENLYSASREANCRAYSNETRKRI
ncbi:hypothetical protein FACS1894208_09490 [Clostridia bacterium]|nr:hypothetical protein FACS1894208_09490 [Clostridia bacterium]